jgi:hypothetical protein
MTLIETHTHNGTVYQIYGLSDKWVLVVDGKHYGIYGTIDVARGIVRTLVKEAK